MKVKTSARAVARPGPDTPGVATHRTDPTIIGRSYGRRTPRRGTSMYGRAHFRMAYEQPRKFTAGP